MPSDKPRAKNTRINITIPTDLSKAASLLASAKDSGGRYLFGRRATRDDVIAAAMTEAFERWAEEMKGAADDA